MRLKPSRKMEISSLAEEVGESFFGESFLEPLDVAESEGITYSFGHYEDAFDGMLECSSGKFHIYCNLDRLGFSGSERARFTLAHELGHYFIDEHRAALLSGNAPAHSSFCEYRSANLVEKEADLFASHLLMPSKRFRSVALQHDIGLPGVEAASRFFKTSLTSAAIKYVEMDMFVSAVIFWKSGGFGWKWLSGTMHRMGYRKTVERIDEIPRFSATAQLMRGASSEKIIDSRIRASLWFPYIKQGSRDNFMLIEQAISLGRFGCLTFLYPEEEEL